MNRLDSELLALLVRDARMSYADLARELGVSRAHARNRVQALVDAGVIEQFAAVVNPDKLGKVVSAFVDLKVRPAELQAVAEELADCPEVVSLYIMNDLQSLHIHTLTDSPETFEAFVRRRIFNRPEIVSVDCKTLLARVKNRRGGMRV
jgi:DNA-binding Lrp family transcriptional regulator